MKKLNLSIGVLAMSVLALTACSDDDNGQEYTRENTIQVVSSNVNFNARENTGYVVVDAPSAINADIDASWATATVKGDSVLVAVSRNARLEGRAAQLTIKSGADSVHVAVQQLGSSFVFGGENEFIYNDEAREISIPIDNYGSNITFESPDWITASSTDSLFSLQLAENSTGGIRSGYVYYNYGPHRDSIFIAQGEKKDIVGKQYVFAAYDLTKSQDAESMADMQVMLLTTVMEDEESGDLYLVFNSEEFYLPFTFDDASLTSGFYGGQLVGTYYNRYYIYSAVVDLSLYQQFNQSDETVAYTSFMAAPYVSMTGQWGALSGIGNVCLLDDNTQNDSWFSYLFSSVTSYNGTILGMFAYSSQMVAWNSNANIIANLESYAGPLHLYYQPMLMEYSTSSAKNLLQSMPNGEKPALKVNSRRIPIK